MPLVSTPTSGQSVGFFTWMARWVRTRARAQKRLARWRVQPEAFPGWAQGVKAPLLFETRVALGADGDAVL